MAMCQSPASRAIAQLRHLCAVPAAIVGAIMTVRPTPYPRGGFATHTVRQVRQVFGMLGLQYFPRVCCIRCLFVCFLLPGVRPGSLAVHSRPPLPLVPFCVGAAVAMPLLPHCGCACSVCALPSCRRPPAFYLLGFQFQQIFALLVACFPAIPMVAMSRRAPRLPVPARDLSLGAAQYLLLCIVRMHFSNPRRGVCSSFLDGSVLWAPSAVATVLPAACGPHV